MRGSSILLHKALVAAAIVIPAAAFLAAAMENRRNLLREGEGMVQRTAIIFDEHARKVFETVDLALGRVDDRIRNLTDAQIDADETNQFLRALRESLPHSVSIWVSDASGAVLAGSQAWDRRIGIGEREFFKAHKDGGPQTRISAAFTGRATRTLSFAVSRPRTTASGEFNGVVHMALSPDYFSAFFRQASPTGRHVAMLLRADGSVLARNPAGGPEKLGPESPLMRAIHASPEFGVFRGAIEGVEGFSAHARAAPYDVYVVYGASDEVLAERWFTNLRLYGAVAGAASIFLLALSLLALRRVQAEHEALRQLSIQSEQRLAAEQRLFQSQKMESLGQLTGGIAHDFNNLLAVVLGNLSLLGKFVRGNERAELLLERAIQGAERGASLTQRLLAFARRQDLAPQSVDVAMVVRSVMDLFRSTLGAGVEIVADVPAGAPPALVDPNQLELAVLNLAVNARDAMPAGGRITLSVSAQRFGDDNVLGLPAGEYVCLGVSDNGAGMDDKTLARASEPFFTTKDVGKGTGLGLSMVHGLAIQSGGAFRLESRLGAGTRAEIWLPRAPRSAAAPAETLEPASKAPLSGRILVVDDDVLVREATAAMLADEGYAVVEATGAAQALALIEEQSFDLMVTDLVMPGMSGVALAARVSAARPGLPVLVMTGHAERAGEVPPDLQRIGKPFSPAELSAAVARALASAPE